MKKKKYATSIPEIMDSFNKKLNFELSQQTDELLNKKELIELNSEKDVNVGD